MRPLVMLLASPRGYCAGVERAIQAVEKALLRFGAPVYVRHEIVHNPFVIAELKAKGAVFVQELDEVPECAAVVFSAHGIPKSVRADAERRQLIYIDATCPLVTKVHREVEHHVAAGRQVILIGHADHPEIVGTMGQVSSGTVTLVQTVADAVALPIEPAKLYAYATQTTLSLTDTAEIVAILRRRIPRLYGPARSDICYATTNRQEAVKSLAERCDAVIVVGGPNSSNSRRLVDAAMRAGRPATLIGSAQELKLSFLEGVNRVGATSGASTPEALVTDLIDYLSEQFDLSVEEMVLAKESIQFNLPPITRHGAKRPTV
jgi:4-hydroxy-3-methylbut-2-en-1-yl diphosphate reductase